MTTASHPLDEPVFLAGSTRSGTTLLRLMLDHHPEIAFPGELEWAMDFRPDEDEPPLEEFHAWLEIDRHRRRHGLRIDRSLPFRKLVRSFLDQMQTRRGPHKRWLGAQVHRNWRRALQVWPRARFIRLMRDGRDVCASWIRMGWEGNTFLGARSWVGSVSEWEQVRPSIPDDRIVHVRFEELIRRPEETLDRICRFVGTEFHPAMLDYHRHTTYGPVRPDQAGKWRQTLSDWDVRVFEGVAGHELVDNGYELSGLPPIPINRWTSLGLDLDARVRQNLARMRFYGPGLYVADHVSRRVPLRGLRERVKLQMNAIVDASLK